MYSRVIGNISSYLLMFYFMTQKLKASNKTVLCYFSINKSSK